MPPKQESGGKKRKVRKPRSPSPSSSDASENEDIGDGGSAVEIIKCDSEIQKRKQPSRAAKSNPKESVIQPEQASPKKKPTKVAAKKPAKGETGKAKGKGAAPAWSNVGQGHRLLADGDNGESARAGQEDSKKEEEKKEIDVASQEERRRKFAEAAAMRYQTEASRGLQNPPGTELRKKQLTEVAEMRLKRFAAAQAQKETEELEEKGQESQLQTPPLVQGEENDKQQETDEEEDDEMYEGGARPVDGPLQEERRKILADAATKRVETETNRGIKNPNLVKFQQHRRDEIEKRQEQAAQMGHDGKPALRWQV